MIVLSESLLLDGAPQRDPMAIPHNLTHNPDLHFTFTKFWKRYGKFARHLMKVGQFSTPLLETFFYYYYFFKQMATT